MNLLKSEKIYNDNEEYTIIVDNYKSNILGICNMKYGLCDFKNINECEPLSLFFVKISNYMDFVVESTSISSEELIKSFKNTYNKIKDIYYNIQIIGSHKIKVKLFKGIKL